MGAKIKGITIEIGGQTTNLQASLKAASDKGKEAATELSKINSSLKFNPDNVDLLGQKMDVLRDRISATEDTLNTLKDAQGSIEEQFKKGDIGADQYREFQRELIETESKLENFKKQLLDTGKEIQSMSKISSEELKEIETALKINPDSVILLEQKMHSLKQEISYTKEHMKSLKETHKDVETQFKNGEISADEYREYQREVETTKAQLKDLKDSLYKTTTEFKDNRSIVGKVENSYSNLKEKIENVKDRHSNLITVLDKTKSIAGGIAKGELKLLAGAAGVTATGVAGVTAAGVGLVNKLLEISEETKELRDNLGKLETAFTTNGHSAETSVSTYKDLYGVLGDGDKATEAANHLALLTDNQKELADWVNISTGVYGTFGDSLPIESLTEAANETAKTGKLTGALADALNWVGINEEDFQKKLDACSTEQERQALITETLNKKYSDAAEKYREVNAVLIEAQEKQAEYNISMADLGEAVDNIKNKALAEFLPGVTDVVDGLTALLSGDEGAPELIKQGINGIVQGIEDFLPEVTGILSGLTNTAAEIAPAIILSLSNGILDNLDGLTSSAFTMLETLSESLLTESNIKTLVTSAITLVSNFASFLGDNSDLLINSAFILIESLIDGLLEDGNTGKLVNSALDITTALVTGLIDHAPDMIQGAFSLIGALVGAIIDYDWWSVARDIFNGIKSGLKQLITGEAEDSSNKTSGSHAGGLAYVPYDGYVSELHEGERILTAAENRNYNRERQEKAAEFATLNRKIDAVTSSAQAASKRPINIIATGTARGIARSLTYYVEEEEDRQGVIKRNK